MSPKNAPTLRGRRVGSHPAYLETHRFHGRSPSQLLQVRWTGSTRVRHPGPAARPAPVGLVDPEVTLAAHRGMCSRQERPCAPEMSLLALASAPGASFRPQPPDSLLSSDGQ